MKTIFVVRRSFKSAGVFYPVGSVVADPTGIKLLKSKINEGKLVPLKKDSDNLEHTIRYIKNRIGIDIKEDILEAFIPKEAVKEEAPGEPTAAPPETKDKAKEEPPTPPKAVTKKAVNQK